ncbi:hypothetical protein RB595_000928 [Gaeumannomyces hyphopodioides]
MLRPRIPLPRLGRLARIPQARFIHKLRPLKHDFAEKGIGEEGHQFLSPEAVDFAYTQYQTLVLEKLNKLTVGQEDDLSNTPNGLLSLITRTARDPNKAPTFNYASMAHNNEFFFNGLCHKGPPIPQELKQHLVEAFGSIETLRYEFLLTAFAMFGPGYVWLVRTRHPSTVTERFRLMVTYLAGTPYPEAHYRQQRTDMNTGGNVDEWMASQRAAVAPAGPGGAASRSKLEPAPGGLKGVVPVLCLNTWEHVYLPDYGILTPEGKEGKREYIYKWWDHVDWNVVADRANLAAGTPSLIS